MTIQITTSNNNETTLTLATKSKESLSENKVKHTLCSYDDYNESQDDTNDKENRTPNKRRKISI